MEKVAVTGYTGFIGKNLVKELLKRNFRVYLIGRDFESVECDRVYHLACPSNNKRINDNPIEVMDIIIDGTRSAMEICSNALFINASSMGVNYLNSTPQGAYNIAKKCMETYIHNSGINYKNYRLPSVYGIDCHADSFIMRCVNGTAYRPSDPDKDHYIAHINEVVSAMIELRDVNMETIKLGEIYEKFSSGQRNLDK